MEADVRVLKQTTNKRKEQQNYELHSNKDTNSASNNDQGNGTN